MFLYWSTIGVILLSLSGNEAYFSEGVWAVSDVFYDGGIYDGTAVITGAQFVTEQVSYGFAYSEQMYSVRSVRECKLICLQHGCPSFAIDRKQEICYITSFNECTNNQAYLRMYPDYITYEIVQGGTPANGIKKTCFHQCLDNAGGDCDKCGRSHCFGIHCDDCKKACWEIPPIVNATVLWPDLTTVVTVYCSNEWQLAFQSSSFATYAYMLQLQPLWLRVVITLNDSTVYESYFDSFETDGWSQITIGNYVGGSAGNAWGPPATLKLRYVNTTTCYPFFYHVVNCSITQKQIPTIKNQVNSGKVYDWEFTRGYVWNRCGQDYGPTVYVANIQLWVTPKNASDPNPQFLVGLKNVTCQRMINNYSLSTNVL